MRKSKPPPVQARMIDTEGNLNPQWLRWFQTVGLFFDDYRRSPDLDYTANATLTTDDFGKSIVFNVGAGTLTCNLMTITSKDVHCWLGPIYRIGTGKLIITADRASKIEYSSFGGIIICEEYRRIAANVTLEVVSSHQWGIIGGTGLWLTD
jgi:hypothetical protein